MYRPHEINKMWDISAKELRKEVINNIENCENFNNVFEMIFESDYSNLAKFKAKHVQEGEFTDEDGVIVLATGYYLGVTLRIFSQSNTRLQPYTEHNENKSIIFNIFLDDRSINSEHFQSLKHIGYNDIRSSTIVNNEKLSETNKEKS